LETSAASVGALRPLGIGEILDRAVTLCVKHFLLLALVWLAFAVPLAIFAFGNIVGTILGGQLADRLRDRLAIVAACAAIDDDAHHRKIVDYVVSERRWLEDQLRELGFERNPPSAANFVFVKPALGNSAAAVADALRERRILVRHYDLDPIAGWFRITVGTRGQHERLLAALKEILI